MVTLSFTIFSGQKNYNRAHMLFQVLCGFEPIFYTTHPNEESYFVVDFGYSGEESVMRHVPDNIFYCKGVFNGNYTANPK